MTVFSPITAVFTVTLHPVSLHLFVALLFFTPALILLVTRNASLSRQSCRSKHPERAEESDLQTTAYQFVAVLGHSQLLNRRRRGDTAGPEVDWFSAEEGRAVVNNRSHSDAAPRDTKESCTSFLLSEDQTTTCYVRIITNSEDLLSF